MVYFPSPRSPRRRVTLPSLRGILSRTHPARPQYFSLTAPRISTNLPRSMGTLNRYILRQTVATLSLTVAVFTALLLLGSVLKDILNLLAAGTLTLGQVAQAIGYLIPFVLAFALPIGMLTAALLVFGRLSADQEITAARAGGWSLVALAAPVLYFSVGMCALCGWFNMEVAPRCRVAFTELRQQAAGLGLNPRNAALVTEGQYVERGSFTIYARKTRGTQMEDVLVYQLKDGHRLYDAHAQSGELVPDDSGQTAELILHDVQVLQVKKSQGTDDLRLWPSFHQEIRTNLPLTGVIVSLKPKYSDMTFGQLWQERRAIQAQGGEPAPVVMQMHRQTSFSFACFGFTLLGIPLGLRGHRRETNMGIGIALLLMLIYYSFIILGQALETHPRLHPHLILWAPNFLFIGCGAWLLWRADRVGN